MKDTLLSTALVAALFFSAGTARAASFTYHGTLRDSGKPAQGNYDIELTLYSTASGGSVIGGPLVMYKVPVTSGSFNTEADFGPMVTAFDQAFVGVRVRNAGNGEFTALDARELVSAAATSSVCPGAWTLGGNAGNPSDSYLGTADSQPLTFKVNGLQVGQIAKPFGGDQPNVIFGSSLNSVDSGATGATIGGGGSPNPFCGPSNNAPCINSAGSGGTVSGGSDNRAGHYFSTVSGGQNNLADAQAAAVMGGTSNAATGDYSAVTGGDFNTASGANSIVAGGVRNVAGGDDSLAAGAYATVASGDHGTFVWADDSDFTSFTSTGPDQFLIRATGGVGINAAPDDPNVELNVVGNGAGPDYANVFLRQASQPAGILMSAGSATALSNNAAFYIDRYDGVNQSRIFAISPTGLVAMNGAPNNRPLIVGTNNSNGNGAYLTAGGVWTSSSSRTFKDDFARVDVLDVLSRVVAMPVQTWFYKNDHEEGRHMGPVAEDFARMFALGNDDKHIGAVDESGVAFAAIQGLNKKIEAEQAENAALRSKLDEVVARLSKLENKKGE